MNAASPVTVHTKAIPRVAVAGLSLVAMAWAVLGVLTVLGVSDHASHDALLGHGQHGLSPAEILVFLAVWTVMALAMMLPSSLPAVVGHADMENGAPGLTLVATVAATAVTWSAFAVAALAGDAVLHELVESGTLPKSVQALLPAFVLIAAGVFQVSPVKHRFLAAARTATRPIQHALFCLGSCWALMLVMVALGSGSLILMAGLTVLMVLEQVVRRGDIVASLAGSTMIATGLFVVSA